MGFLKETKNELQTTCVCVSMVFVVVGGGGAVFNFVLGFFRKSSLCQTESVNL